MQMRKTLLSILALAFFAISASSQNRTVTGKVTDEKGNPVEGVSITIAGGKVGTQTDKNGMYTISISKGTRLIFSNINFETASLGIPTSGMANISLKAKDTKLDEVVVVAYGTQKKSSLTGSVSSINADDLLERPVTNISQALAGAAPGIAATSGNGQPGSGAAIRIRGFGSINASSEPLYVVDGFPYGGFIGDINTNDIESISLLKDASSTALYGARAANGVVMITTKKGKTAAPRINLYTNYGISSRGIGEYDKVNTLQYYPLIWQGIKMVLSSL
jgi:TonB-dependent SusC/RagA subfamily outer membrane receptor